MRFILALALILFPQDVVNGPTKINGPTIIQTGTGGGSAPTQANQAACGAVFTDPITCSLGTVNVNDIVLYYDVGEANSLTLTPSLTGTCATSGGFGTPDIGPTNQGTALGTAQVGHAQVTTGGSCTLSITGAGANQNMVIAVVIRGSTGLDVKSAFNNQNAAANPVTSASITTTFPNDFCQGLTGDDNIGNGTITANSPWTTDTNQVTNGHFASEHATFSPSSSSVQATFNFTVGPYSQTAVICFHS
jgi:hypothetical protein